MFDYTINQLLIFLFAITDIFVYCTSTKFILMKIKNPLSVQLGIFLKYERKRLSKSTQEFASSLGIGHSFYRMIESGSSNFSISKAFNLIKLLSDRKVELDKISKLLVAIQTLEILIDKDNPNSLADALFEIQTFNDVEINKLVELAFRSEEVHGKNEYEKYLQDYVPKQLISFLSGDYYEVDEDSKLFRGKIIKQINETPSLTLEIILDFIKVMSNHPPQHIMGIAEKWEIDNKKKIKRVIGAYKNPDIIISELNVSKFKSPYLFEKNFESIDYFFFNTTKNPLELKEKFIRLIEKHNSRRLTEDQKNMISIKCSNKKSILHAMDINLTTNYEDDEILEAFWFFNMESGNQIGFVGVREDDTDKIWNLTYGEVLEKSSVLKTILDNES